MGSVTGISRIHARSHPALVLSVPKVPEMWLHSACAKLARATYHKRQCVCPDLLPMLHAIPRPQAVARSQSAGQQQTCDPPVGVYVSHPMGFEKNDNDLKSRDRWLG